MRSTKTTTARSVRRPLRVPLSGSARTPLRVPLSGSARRPSRVSLPGSARRPLRVPIYTIGTTILLLALYALLGPAPEYLIYDRDAVAGGQVWRLLTAHLVHSDSAHLLWNVFAFALNGLIAETLLTSHGGQSQRDKLSPAGWGGVMLSGMLAVGLWVHFAQPDLQAYCGLSGVLNTLFFASAILLWRREHRLDVALLTVGAVIKIIIEAATPMSLVPGMAWAAVPLAHGAGALAAVMFFVAQRARARAKTDRVCYAPARD